MTIVRRPIATAPTDGTQIIGHGPDGEDLIAWRDERWCVIGPPQGSHGPGWVSIDAGGLPVDEPPDWSMHWTDTHAVQLDWTVMFGVGYDFEGLDNHRLEARGLRGRYLIWPDRDHRGRRWSLYATEDGGLAFQAFDSKEEAMVRAERWDGWVTSWPAGVEVPRRMIPRRPPLGSHRMAFASYSCELCGIPMTELWNAPELQRWCTGARDGDWERRKAGDEPRRAALRAESDRAFAVEALAAEDAQTFTWGQIRRAFGIPPEVQ